MGNEVSGEADYDDEDDYAKQFDGIETLGYRVLGVQPDSPASKAGLVSFFDFIVGANHQMLLGSGVGLEEGEEYDDVDFPLLLRENIHKPVLLLVYNIKAREQREVQLIPSDDWGGAGLLGVTIKLDDYGGADEKLVRVLEVDEEANGPAKLAGLIPQQDFLLGTTATTLTNTDVLATLLTMHLERVVELYVYNSDTDLVRIVGLHPTYNWGYGESMLGAAVGTGYLHRLPESCRGTIGKSVERTVSIVEHQDATDDPNQIPGGVGELHLNQTNIRMEGTLEMEPSEDGDDEVDGDVGLAARGMQVQPHRLGQPQQTAPDNSQAPSATPVTKVPPPPEQDPPAMAPFPDAAPMPHAFSTPQPNPPPPPPAEPPISPRQVVPPPPPPPPAEPPTSPSQLPPPPPPPPVSPTPQIPPPPPMDPPASEEHHDDEYSSSDGSEYTDGSELYSDDEEPAEAPRSGGLFGFMAPPPKMNY